MAQRQESESKRKKGKAEYVNVWFKVIKDTNSCSVDSRECQQVPSLYFNLLLLFFFLPCYTRLALNYQQFGLKREGTVVPRDSGHPSTLCRQEAMQILAASLNPTDVRCLNMFGEHLQLSNNSICLKNEKKRALFHFSTKEKWARVHTGRLGCSKWWTNICREQRNVKV